MIGAVTDDTMRSCRKSFSNLFTRLPLDGSYTCLPGKRIQTSAFIFTFQGVHGIGVGGTSAFVPVDSHASGFLPVPPFLAAARWRLPRHTFLHDDTHHFAAMISILCFRSEYKQRA
jgi:hypothetical protein